MRCVAGAGLLLLVGCNQIFGISSTQSWDAPVDVIADMPHVALTWQIAATLPSGAPAPTLSYPPFDPAGAPVVRIAPLDGPFESASYSSDLATPGWIRIPRHYFEDKDTLGHNKPWRLEYTLPGAVPREVQWTPKDKLGHLTVPMVGRLDRQTAPMGGGYLITANNPPASYKGPRLWTTGLWTAGAINATSGAMIDYDFFNSVSLSGAKGSPDAAQGDRAFLVDVFTDSVSAQATNCQIAIGSAALTSIALAPNTHTPQTVNWDAGTKPVTSDPVDVAILDRLTTSLGPLYSGKINSNLSKQLFGVVASTDFPGLTGTWSIAPLPIPVMQTLLQCPFDVKPLPRTAQPTLLEDFPQILHVQLVDSRAELGVTVNSELEAVIAASSSGFKIAFPAPLPTQMKLVTPASGTLDLAGTADQLSAGAPDGTFTLSFVPETGTGLRADYHDVILHRIIDDALTIERIYTVTTPSVRIDGSVLAPNADYLFEIRTYKGHVMAPLGDFAPVDYPYGAGIVYTRTFKTS